MRIALISDTHGSHILLPEAPYVDALVHAGDFMNSGRYWDEIESFNTWLETIDLPKNRKLICAGNHDIFFDECHTVSSLEKSRKARRMITNGTYLQDESFEIKGVKFYFSPWTPYFMGWGFNVNRGPEIKEFWDKIPDDTNVLVTHGPPLGILDTSSSKGPNLGCEELSKRIASLKHLKVHVFGHIHRGHGKLEKDGVTYVNASFLNEEYRPYPGAGYRVVEV
jgi:Icc-related predicted phosphoesterase